MQRKKILIIASLILCIQSLASIGIAEAAAKKTLPKKPTVSPGVYKPVRQFKPAEPQVIPRAGQIAPEIKEGIRGKEDAYSPQVGGQIFFQLQKPTLNAGSSVLNFDITGHTLISERDLRGTLQCG